MRSRPRQPTWSATHTEMLESWTQPRSYRIQPSARRVSGWQAQWALSLGLASMPLLCFSLSMCATPSSPSLRVHPCKRTRGSLQYLSAQLVWGRILHMQDHLLRGAPDMHAGNGREFMLSISGCASMFRALCPIIGQAETIILKARAAHKIQAPAAASCRGTDWPYVLWSGGSGV